MYRHGRLRCCCFCDCAAREAAASDQLDRRPHDAVAHDEHGDSRAANDVHLRVPLGPCRYASKILADQRIEGADYLLLRDSDENDRLGMLDQLETPDHPGRLDADHDMDRLSGIADRAGEIGVEIDVSRHLVAPVDGGDGRIALRVAESVGAFEYFRRLNLLQEFRQPSCRRRRNCIGQDNGCQGDRGESEDRTTGTPV